MAVRDEKLKAFVDGYYTPSDDQLGRLRVSNEKDSVPLILTETEGILKLLLEMKKPARILELGTAHGYSALFFARTLPDAVITTVERNAAMYSVAEETIAEYKESGRINILKGDALTILEELAEEIRADESRRFDFVFIDAGKSHYTDFFKASERICTQDALIVCDNILIKGWVVEAEGKDAKRHRTNIKYMKQFLDYINEREDLEVTLLTGGDGLAVIRFRK